MNTDGLFSIVNTTRKRFQMFGALGGGRLAYRLCDMPDSDSLASFLRALRKRHGRTLLFAGNASCHKSKKVRDEPDGTGSDIVPEYFLPHAPEPSPVEGQLRTAKKAVANRMHEGVDGMKDPVRRMLGTREIPVAKMSHYLIV